MNEQPDTRYPRIAPTQQAFPTGYSVGIPPPPPQLPPKRSARAFLLLPVLIILLGATALLSYHLGSTVSLAHQLPPREGVITSPVTRPAPSINAVIAAIKRQPGNNVTGVGILYGSSVSNWLGQSGHAYDDWTPSVSSATWSAPYTGQGPGGPPSGIWIYQTVVQAGQEYAVVSQESKNYQNGSVSVPPILSDIGVVTWQLVGVCLTGNMSKADALALPALCG